MSQFDQAPSGPQISFDTPPPPLSDPVQDRVAHYKSAGIDISEAEARYQVDMERRIDTDPNKGKFTPNERAIAEHNDQIERRFQALHEQRMASAASEFDYEVPMHSSFVGTVDGEKQQAGVQAALRDAGFPLEQWNNIARNLNVEWIDSLPFSKRDEMFNRTADVLRSAWGSEFESRIRNIQAFQARHPALASDFGYLTYDAGNMSSLSDAIEQWTRRQSGDAQLVNRR